MVYINIQTYQPYRFSQSISNYKPITNTQPRTPNNTETFSTILQSAKNNTPSQSTDGYFGYQSIWYDFMDKSYDYGFNTHIAGIDRSAYHKLEEFDVIGENGEVLSGIKRLNMDTPNTYVRKGGGFDILSEDMKEYLKQKYNPREMTTELHFEMMSELAALGVIRLKEWGSWSDVMHMDLGLIGFEGIPYATMPPGANRTMEYSIEVAQKQNEAEWLKVFSNKNPINWFENLYS